MANNKLNNVWDGVCGASAVLFALVTPFLRFQRIKWGATKQEIEKELPAMNLYKIRSGGIPMRFQSTLLWPKFGRGWCKSGRGGAVSTAMKALRIWSAAIFIMPTGLSLNFNN